MKSVPASWFWVVVVVALFSLFYCGYLSLALSACEQDLNYYYEGFLYYYSVSEQLSEELNVLRGEYFALLSDYNTLRAEYDVLEQAYDDLLGELNVYRDRVDYIYSWITSNAKFPSGLFSEQIRGCVQGRYINYPCVVWRRGFEYIPDGGDHLKSPREFVRDGGGDCEDFAMYALALIRSAVSRGYGLKFYRSGSGRFFLNSRWYIPDAEDVRLDGVSTVYVVCGYLSDSDDYQHCMVQVCSGESCIYVEPQTGEVVDGFQEVMEILSPESVVVWGVDLGNLR